MRDQKKYLNLKVIDVDKIYPHENSDYSRVKPIAENIKRMNIFTNPILVTPVENDIYMQVDGMSRLFAAKKVGLKSILSQVVDYNDYGSVDVSTWCHLSPIKKEPFLSEVAKIKGITIKQGSRTNLRRRYVDAEEYGFLCSLVFDNKEIFRCLAGGGLDQKVALLCRIVEIYKDQITRDILPDNANLEHVDELFKKYTDLHSMVVFPTFTGQQIIQVTVHQKTLFPAGLTRFIIKNRCLDVDFPVKYLMSDMPEKEKNVILENFLKNKQYRIYQEPTIYFEP